MGMAVAGETHEIRSVNTINQIKYGIYIKYSKKIWRGTGGKKGLGKSGEAPTLGG